MLSIVSLHNALSFHMTDETWTSLQKHHVWSSTGAEYGLSEHDILYQNTNEGFCFRLRKHATYLVDDDDCTDSAQPLCEFKGRHDLI